MQCHWIETTTIFRKPLKTLQRNVWVFRYFCFVCTLICTKRLENFCKSVNITSRVGGGWICQCQQIVEFHKTFEYGFYTFVGRQTVLKTDIMLAFIMDTGERDQLLTGWLL